MQPRDLDLLSAPGAPTVHPDGTRAVVSVVRPDLTDDEYVGQLWEVSLDGGPLRRLTRGYRDTEPRFSPDGARIAFLRAAKGERPQLHVIDARGGEPLRVSYAPLGAGAPRWSPDSRRLAYVARVPEPGRYGTAEGIGPEAEPPRLVTTLDYRYDGVGFTLDRRQQVFVVEVPEPEPAPPVPAEDGTAAPAAQVPEAVQVTSGDTDATDVTWSPDRNLLAFVSARHPERHTTLVTDVHVCAPDGTAVRQVSDGSLTASGPKFSPDGSTLWFLGIELGPDGLDFVGGTTGLFHAPVPSGQAVTGDATTGEGAGTPPTRCTSAQDVDLGEIGSNLHVRQDAVLVQNRTRGAVHLLRVPVDGSPAQLLLGGARQIRGVDVSTNGVVVATVADSTSSGDLVVLHADGQPADGQPADGGARRVTDLSAPLRDTGRVHDLHEATVTADDGYPVHGWVVVPPGEGPHPVILSIHGGPYAQYGWGLFDEAQVYASAGYAVLMCNPRGAAGYGEEHGRAIRGAMGQRDAADITAFLEGVLADPPASIGATRLDPDRVGVAGGSYGGYMTAWLVSHTDRFTACVVERGFLDPVSFVGSADIGWFFPDQYLGCDAEQVRAQSPMARVDHIRTPTLVVHSEQDWRCPVEQGQRLYVALKRRGVDTALLLFPGEGHELTRSGRPRHRLQRFEHVLRWWARHLPTEANPAPVAQMPG